MGRRRICEERPSARRSACDPLNRATSDAMFKIIAVVVIGILVKIGFFDIGQEAYTLAALLLGIGALVDSSQKRSAAPVTDDSSAERRQVAIARMLRKRRPADPSPS